MNETIDSFSISASDLPSANTLKTPTTRMAEILKAYSQLNRSPIDSFVPRLARDLPTMQNAAEEVLSHHLLTRLASGSLESIGRIESRKVPTASGEILLRLYYPDSERDLPILVYLHGGGFVVGNLNSADSICRSLANGSDCIVISVAYRQAPEFPYPAAHDDVYHAYLWIQHHAKELGGDPNAIAIGGDGAGGNLAASTCLRLRDERIRLPVHQLLVYPILDNDTERESYFENRHASPLNRAAMLWAFRHYLPVEGDDYAFPLQAENLSGLPPATIITAEIDPLRDEAEIYADRLRESGVSVINEHYLGVTHEFFSLKGILPEARDAHQLACDNLEYAFANRFNLSEILAEEKTKIEERNNSRSLS